MGFFDEIGKKISQTASDSAKKTREFVEVSKLNAQMTDEKKNITNLFAQIGEQYYNANAVNPQPEFAEMFQAIAASNQKIIELQEEIKKIRNVHTCPNCGAECVENIAFCGSCGAALPVAAAVPQEAAAPAPIAKTCASCGATLPDDAVFCTACGNKTDVTPQ